MLFPVELTHDSGLPIHWAPRRSIPAVGGGSLKGIFSVGPIMFVVLMPFFALRELARDFGDDTPHELFSYEEPSICQGNPNSANSLGRRSASPMGIELVGVFVSAAIEAGSLSGDEPRPAGLRGRLEASQAEAWRSGRRLLRFSLRDLVLLSGVFRNKFGRGLACRLAVLARLSRRAPGRPGDLPLGVFFVRRRDRTDLVALEIDPRRAGLERLQIARGPSVHFQCARDQARPKLRVLGDDIVVDADLERLTRLAKAARIEFGELGNALVHLESPRLIGSDVLPPDAFQQL